MAAEIRDPSDGLRALLPVCAVGQDGNRWLLAVLGFYGTRDLDVQDLVHRIHRLWEWRNEVGSLWIPDNSDHPEYCVEIAHGVVTARLAASSVHTISTALMGFTDSRPLVELLRFMPITPSDPGGVRLLRDNVVERFRGIDVPSDDPFAIDSNGVLLYNSSLSEWAEEQFESFSSRSMNGLWVKPPFSDSESTLSRNHHVSKQSPEATSNEIVTSVIEQVTRVSDPLGRIVILDLLSHDLMPALYEQMMSDAAEVREGGGTWRQIGETLGVTPQAAQKRLDPEARRKANSASARRERGQSPR